MRPSLPPASVPVLVAFFALPAAANAQQSSAEQALETWRAEHGRAWRQLFDEESGSVEMLYGGSAPAAFVPRTDAEFERLARAFVAETAALHGVADATLVQGDTVFLPLGQVGSTDKLTVRFEQAVAGVPVVGGSVNVLMDAASGALLSVQSSALPGVEATSTQPSLEAGAAAQLAREHFEGELGFPPESSTAPELVLLPREGAPGAALAWQLDLRRDLAGATPDVRRTWIDAHTGAVLQSEDRVHHLDVGGTVRALATPGTKPDTGGNPEQPSIMPHVYVTSTAGISKANADGEFNFQGVNGPLTCTFIYEGPFALVTNDAGGEYSLTLDLSGTGNSVLMNPGTSQHDTAQANAYDEINVLRSWIRSVIPSDGTADFQALANCNISASCNAYYDGGSVNFFAAGGGCVNTAYSTVVAHEMGHWLNNLYDTNNGSDGMGEGNADVFAMYLYDTPIVGEDFCGNGCHIRNGNNTVQYCGDCCPGCHGGVHANGQVWMGAAWKVRRNLNQTHGDSTGDAMADLLFLSWLNAYDQTQIHSIIEAQWLALDDDDGFIENGSPNYADIDGAFREQGFPGVDLVPCFGGSYCVTSPNSVGEGALMSFTSSLSVGQNDTVLSVADAPAGELGLFFYGSSQALLPFGNGIRCVGGSTYRLPIVTIDAGGAVDQALDITSPPQPGGQITAGSLWFFQFWYRDPAGGGANFNVSDALGLAFCD